LTPATPKGRGFFLPEKSPFEQKCIIRFNQKINNKAVGGLCLGVMLREEGKKMTPSSIEEKAGSGGNSLDYIPSLELPLF